MMGKNDRVPEISIILATRNRVESLRETLGALAAQETGGAFTYEVLVADNGSSDGTRQAIERCRPGYPVSLRYVFEGCVGKSWALNAGLREARGSIVAFTDDDCLPSPTWLAALWTCFTEAQADAVAGKVVPKPLGPTPEWWDLAVRDINHMGLGCLDHGSRRLRTQDGYSCHWVGGNMAIRREKAQQVGDFNVRLVRGQDAEYYDRWMERGLQVVYEPAALVYHKIGPDRLSVDYLRRWRHRQGYYNAYRVPWKSSHLLTVMPLWRGAVTVRVLGEWVRAVVTRQSWWTRFLWELKLRSELGVWAHRFQQWPRQWLVFLAGRGRGE